MKFAAPDYLWFLLLAPLLAAFLWRAWRRKQRLMAQFVQERLFASLAAGVSLRRQKLRLGLLVAAVACAAFALARPQWGYGWEEAKHRGIDILVAIDTSRSMLAEDVKPNRMERAKLAALDLMKLAKNDRLGLVAFAGSAFLQCPLTLDEEAFRQSVGALDVGIMPQGGTALAESIETAVKAFKDEKENHRVLVLVTDGEDNEPGAIEAAKAAKEKGFRIFTIGVGSPDGELIRVPDDKGKLVFLRDDAGNIVKSRLNETLLRKIAGAADGFYLNLRGVNTMEMLYEKGLAPLPKTELDAKMVRRYFERYYWPLALAILLLLAEIFLPERKAVHTLAPSPAAEALRRAVALLALTLALPLAAQASSSSALKDYKAGKYDSAAKEFQRLQDEHPDDPRYSYNAGVAAYQAKDYERAARHFGAALTVPDLRVQQKAFYNSGNTWYQLGEAAKEADERIELWEESIKQYEGALKLNPKDGDAEFNREFVKQKLAKLKKEQQQQQPSQKGKSQKKKDNKPGDQTPGEDGEEGEEPQSKDGKGKKEDGKKKDGGKKKEERTNEEAGPDAGKEDNQQQAERNAGNEMDKEEQRKMALGQMTIQQAQQLLEAMKSEERALIFKPSNAEAKQQPRKFKDW